MGASKLLKTTPGKGQLAHLRCFELDFCRMYWAKYRFGDLNDCVLLLQANERVAVVADVHDWIAERKREPN
jgi:hypothetical protein